MQGWAAAAHPSCCCPLLQRCCCCCVMAQRCWLGHAGRCPMQLAPLLCIQLGHSRVTIRWTARACGNVCMCVCIFNCVACRRSRRWRWWTTCSRACPRSRRRPRARCAAAGPGPAGVRAHEWHMRQRAGQCTCLGVGRWRQGQLAVHEGYGLRRGVADRSRPPAQHTHGCASSKWAPLRVQLVGSYRLAAATAPTMQHPGLCLMCSAASPLACGSQAGAAPAAAGPSTSKPAEPAKPKVQKLNHTLDMLKVFLSLQAGGGGGGRAHGRAGGQLPQPADAAGAVAGGRAGGGGGQEVAPPGGAGVLKERTCNLVWRACSLCA